jgi:hypothetical protein
VPRLGLGCGADVLGLVGRGHRHGVLAGNLAPKWRGSQVKVSSKKWVYLRLSAEAPRSETEDVGGACANRPGRKARASAVTHIGARDPCRRGHGECLEKISSSRPSRLRLAVLRGYRHHGDTAPTPPGGCIRRGFHLDGAFPAAPRRQPVGVEPRAALRTSFSNCHAGGAARLLC